MHEKENEKPTGAYVERPAPDEAAADIPGMQQIVANPNPAANANIPDAATAATSNNPQGEDSITQVGSEITDGEGG